MTKKMIKQTQTVFEEMKKTSEQGIEYWSARELAKVLEYSEYRHFKPVVEKAKEACNNSGQKIKDHFEDLLDMVKIGSGAVREIDDVMLSRYACYLIVQNASPDKEVVALGQTYFAVQTRLPLNPPSSKKKNPPPPAIPLFPAHAGISSQAFHLSLITAHPSPKTYFLPAIPPHTSPG